uniref:Uncharacterized protein n=1 Tax=Rhizophora mucronata TaxID=61149 RepID=A0A2P2MKM5_RHIMU
MNYSSHMDSTFQIFFFTLMPKTVVIPHESGLVLLLAKLESRLVFLHDIGHSLLMATDNHLKYFWHLMFEISQWYLHSFS